MGPGARALLVMASGVIVLAAVKAAGPLLTPIFMAAFVAMVTAPLVSWLRDRGVPSGLAIVLAVTVDLAALLSLAAMVGGSVNAFAARVPHYQVQLEGAAAAAMTEVRARGIELPHDFVMQMIDPAPLLGFLARLFQGLAGFVSTLFLILLVVAFMLLEGLGLEQKLNRVVDTPGGMQAVVKVTRQVKRYLAVKTATSLATGALVAAWVAVCGVDMPLLWGLLAFLFNYIPTIGSIIAAIPATALAALDSGMGTAITLASGYLVVNFLIGNVLEPRAMGKALGLSPLVVLISLVAWGWLLGPMGALLSVPLTIILRIYLANTQDLAWIAVLLGPPGAPEEASAPQN